MVTCVGSIADLFKDRGRIGQIEREFIERRNLVQDKVLADSKRYLATFSIKGLEDQILMYRGLFSEAFKLNHEYRRIIGPQESDNANYNQLIVMYKGAENIVRKEIERRKRYSEV